MSKRAIVLAVAVLPFLMGQFCGGPAPYTPSQKGIVPGVYSGTVHCTSQNKIRGLDRNEDGEPTEEDAFTSEVVLNGGLPQWFGTTTPVVVGDVYDGEFGGLMMSMEVQSVASDIGKVIVTSNVGASVLQMAVSGIGTETYEQTSDTSISYDWRAIMLSDGIPDHVVSFEITCTGTLSR